jgi:hypothetical protein
MNAYDLTTQTHTLIRAQTKCERRLADARIVVDLIRSGRHSMAAITFAETNVKTAQHHLEQITLAIGGRAPVAEWMLAS